MTVLHGRGGRLADRLDLAGARAGPFWRTDQRLPPRRLPDVWPGVAAVVPARDEAEVLPQTLPALLAQDYPGRYRVVVVDDGSTDGTGDIARAAGAVVIDAGEPPAGWTGKLHALQRGIHEAGDVELLLLTDADIFARAGLADRAGRGGRRA